MIEVLLKDYSINIGLKGVILLKYLESDDVEKIYIDIFDTQVENSKSVLGLAVEPKIINGFFNIEFETTSLSSGIYEICVIKIQRKGKPLSELINFVVGRDFKRTFFLIKPPTELSFSNSELLDIILKYENDSKKYFNSGISIKNTKLKNSFCIYIFASGLKIGLTYNFNKYRVQPLNIGLDSYDDLNFTNSFIRNYTKLKVQFKYSDAVRQNSQTASQVSFIYFPKINCDTVKQAHDFALTKTKYILQSFSLTRGASGKVFDTVIVNLNTLECTRFTPPKNYQGNHIVGRMGGENVNQLIKFSYLLEENPLYSLLSSLHKEAVEEKNISFFFFRYWNILEILAESKNYNSSNNLLNYDGKIIYDNLSKQKPKKIKGSINIVFNLISKSNSNLKKISYDTVVKWYSLRNCVAHFGSIHSWNKLSKLKPYAEQAVLELENSDLHKPLLYNLKEIVKSILIEELKAN